MIKGVVDMKVEEVMTKNPIFVHDTDFMTHVRSVIRDRNKRTLPVVDSKNRVIGVLTEKDVLNIYLLYMYSANQHSKEHL